MHKSLVFTILLTLFLQGCDNNSGPYLCAVGHEERVSIEHPFERHGGGVYVFNEKYLLDFKEVELGYEKNMRLNKILRNNFALLKDSNSIEILLFNREDSVWIREEEMFNENKVFEKICYTKKVNDTIF